MGKTVLSQGAVFYIVDGIGLQDPQTFQTAMLSLNLTSVLCGVFWDTRLLSPTQTKHTQRTRKRCTKLRTKYRPLEQVQGPLREDRKKVCTDEGTIR